jgi:mannose-6-phosphate isomerase-like protein (cupin superfamily)
MNPIALTNLIFAWHQFFTAVRWQDLVSHIAPKKSGCGLIYELGNPLNRHNEDCAIADMRSIDFSEPHYHPETEIYFILEGTGLIVIGTQERAIKQGDAIIIPSNVAHFVIAKKSIVIGVICTPPFKAENYVPLETSNANVNFDHNQFNRLSSGES